MPATNGRLSPPSNGGEKEEEEEEEDYLSMAIKEPAIPKQKETYTQRRIRLAREAEDKSRTSVSTPLPKAADLSTSLPATSRGFQMLSKMGYKPGSTLGKAGNPNARSEPLGLAVKDDRGGVGLDSEKKRKFREEVEGVEAKERAEAVGFRERVAKEREERRLEAMLRGAMVVLEGFEAPRSNEGNDYDEGLGKEDEGRSTKYIPTRNINVLWRGLVREREAKERERRMRYDLHQSLSRKPGYNDSDEDADDRLAFGKEEEEVEGVDQELEDFKALKPAESLKRVVEYLREIYHYCFWCKYRYTDEAMEGCPGTTEDDHD